MKINSDFFKGNIKVENPKYFKLKSKYPDICMKHPKCCIWVRINHFPSHHSK